ncbi:MAG: glycosyltransferase [Tannerellaceae bacterium]|jgi:poly(glycerol-phosphate) alpha-glucosyltransferase|nr:glycosyltransferase [Tannerellaceae bacterium]
MKITVYTYSVSRYAGGLLGSMNGLYMDPVFRNTDIGIYAYKDAGIPVDLNKWVDLPVYIYSRHNIFGYSKQVREAVLGSQGNILHVHGLWRYPHAFIHTWRKKTGKPSVVSPHGMLAPYIIKRQGYIKQLIGKLLFADKSFHTVTCYHALCMKELEDIRAYGLTAPIAIIPNAIHLPILPVNSMQIDEKKHLLYLGRLHHKKGIDILITAIALINLEYPELLKEWIVDIVGWGSDRYLKKLRLIVEKYQLQEIIIFHGGLFDEEKRQIYSRADAYILASRGEGLPMTVLEAWSYSLPVIMTPYCNIPEGFETKSAIQVDNTVTSVKEGILQLFNMSDEARITMGKNGRRLVEEQFTWEVSAQKMLRLYDWLLNGGEKPEFVYFD